MQTRLGELPLVGTTDARDVILVQLGWHVNPGSMTGNRLHTQSGHWAGPKLGTMSKLTALLGDITTLEVDAIVNAANNRMRGGGGVDGAIHRAGGPAVLADCMARFPHGLTTGDAGWTTAGDLPARWVIHTVGPNYAAGQRDRALLESCYRRSLEVADDLGAASVAFPLISAGIYGWPKDDAIDVAITTIEDSESRVGEVYLVAFDHTTFSQIEARLSSSDVSDADL